MNRAPWEMVADTFEERRMLDDLDRQILELHTLAKEQEHDESVVTSLHFADMPKKINPVDVELVDIVDQAEEILRQANQPRLIKVAKVSGELALGATSGTGLGMLIVYIAQRLSIPIS